MDRVNVKYLEMRFKRKNKRSLTSYCPWFICPIPESTQGQSLGVRRERKAREQGRGGRGWVVGP